MVSSPSIGKPSPKIHATVIVAHPDDEILWCGGWILLHPDWQWRIFTLCRASDPDRAPRFRNVLRRLGAEGAMADLDDGPEQLPLEPATVRDSVLRLLQDRPSHLIFTHGPHGEYTRHHRHEECCRAVVRLWATGSITTDQLCLFAYEDGGGFFLPQVSKDASSRLCLPRPTWLEKYQLITGLYGFASDSWEARTTPREEGFQCFRTPQAAAGFVHHRKPPP